MTRDLRRYGRDTNRRLLLGFFVIVFVIGDGLIYLFMGRNAAIMGLVCVLGALIPAFLVWLLLWVLEQIVRRANPED
jgi:hypothetical protein